MGTLPIDNKLLPIIQPSKCCPQCIEHVVDVGDLSQEVPGALQAKYQLVSSMGTLPISDWAYSCCFDNWGYSLVLNAVPKGLTTSLGTSIIHYGLGIMF
jgi:hypothetical protein